MKISSLKGNMIHSIKLVWIFEFHYSGNRWHTYTDSKKRTGEQRTYSDLIKGRFDLKRIVTIERKDDIHSIYNKWADYTLETIDKLIKEGEDFEKRSVVRLTPSDADIV